MGKSWHSDNYLIDRLIYSEVYSVAKIEPGYDAVFGIVHEGVYGMSKPLIF